ncbi:MAG: hypothetical protein ACYCS7_09155 [Acidimicrobiales bacterium]
MRAVRVLRRCLVVVVILVLSWPWSPALAEAGTSSTVLATQYVYFWQQQISSVDVGGQQVAPATGPYADPTVPAGDVAVAGPESSNPAPGGGSGPEKETYVEYDVSAIPVGSTINSFDISLPVDPAGQNVFPSGVQAPIIACTPKNAWAGGQQGGQSFSGKPQDSCATSAPKVASTDGNKTFTADITSIAQQWVDPNGLNLGVAITDSPQNTQTVYQVVFGPSPALEKLTATVTYTPPATTSNSATGQQTVTVPSSTGSSGGSGSGLSTPGSVFTGGSTSPSFSTGTGTPTPQSGGQPTASSPTASSPTATVRSAAVVSTTGALPTAWFWLAGVGLLLLLLAASALLGDVGAPAVAEAGRGVSRALARGRRPQLESGPPGPLNP